MPTWIDTHCHLDAAEFQEDRDRVRERARAGAVAVCVLPAVDSANFARVRELAHQYGDAYALGIHPLCSAAAKPEDVGCLSEALQRCRDDPRLVAVGEIGLDYFVPELAQAAQAARQEALLREQLALAQQQGLPVVLHVRRSVDRVLKALRERPVAGGIAHAFNGSLQQAHAFIDLGFRLGFGGALTFERALRIRDLARRLPLHALVLETDAPDIAPHWLYRTAADRAGGASPARNEPGELPRIGAALAGLRGIEPERMAEETTRNALAALPRLAALLSLRAVAQ